MEAIGVPWFIVVRYLGPPLFLLVAGGALLLWRRPARPGWAWAHRPSSRLTVVDARPN